MEAIDYLIMKIGQAWLEWKKGPSKKLRLGAYSNLFAYEVFSLYNPNAILNILRNIKGDFIHTKLPNAIRAKKTKNNVYVIIAALRR